MLPETLNHHLQPYITIYNHHHDFPFTDKIIPKIMFTVGVSPPFLYTDKIIYPLFILDFFNQPPLMLHSAPHLLLLSSSSSAVLVPPFSLFPNSRFLRVSTKPYSLSHQYSTRPLASLLAQLLDSALLEDGPIELPFCIPSFISTDDDPTTLQVATSVLLTGAVSIFLCRSLRRRTKRAKELAHVSVLSQGFDLYKP
ncbi:unnamed protein product [Lactuca virosa]|uniref:Uncharacterized protein n=1 Tax=Lactuca virosa TaxID=75947 RepID=A0AAU9MZ92_9ASTR|nr:unnamed protein product [Lactuca virosa]